MNADKILTLVIYLITVFVMVVIAIVAVFIYRDDIFGVQKEATMEQNPEPALVLEGTTEKTEPLTAEPDSPYPPGYIEAPMSEFMHHMFDRAVKVPGSPRVVEPPPEGRSLELQYSAVPLSELIPEPFGYFGDILLLGDSVTTGFDLFREKVLFFGEPVLRDITVVAVESYGVYNAIQGVSGVHPILNGQRTLPEDIIAAKKQKNIFICLGLNDLVWQKPEEFVVYYSRLVDRIKAKNPEKNIAVMSVTPCVEGHGRSDLENGNIAQANNLLMEYAKENGIHFIDYAAAIRDDGENRLQEDLSSDAYTHLTPHAYERLVEYMLYHPIN